MTREEAKEILTHNWTRVDNPNYSESELDEAFFMAIEALSEQSLINKDAVSREGLLRSWEELSLRGRTEFDQVIMTIPALPSADAVQGEWVEKEVMVDEDTNITEWQSARCSVCGKYHTTPFMYYFDDFNFCPNCGAKMKGGAE